MTVNIINGQPWHQQYEFNETQSGDITGWGNTTVFPTNCMSAQALVTKDRVYVLGGYITSATYTAVINLDGTIGSWSAGNVLPTGIGESQVVLTKNRIYLIGGLITGSFYTANCYTAPINLDGTIGTWATASPIPVALGQHQVIVTKNRAYSLGGYNGGFLSHVFTAPIDEDGFIGTWSAVTSLPGASAASQAVITNNRVYLLGGWSAAGAVDTVYTAPIDFDGIIGAWSTDTSLPNAMGGSQAVTVNGRVYLLGGFPVGSNHSALVQTAPISEAGIIGTWSTGTSLATAKANSAVVVTNSKIYLIGGSVSGSAVTNVQVASFTGGFNDYMTMSYIISNFWTNFSGQTELLI